MALAAAGQTVNAGAGGIRLTAAAHRLAVGQIQASKLRGFQWVDVARQFVAIVLATLLATALSAAVRATALATSFRTWAAWCGTALAISTVVKTRIAAWLLATPIATAFTAAVALAFKAGCALWAIAA